MSDELVTETISELRTIANYQFGAGAGMALFPPGSADTVTIRWSTGGRPRQVLVATGRLVSFGTDGRFTLGLVGGRRLVHTLSSPTARVIVGEESDRFIRAGRNVFAKFVRTVDPAIRPKDDLVVVRSDDTVLGVGKAKLSAEGMHDFETGMAVSIRDSVGEEVDEQPKESPTE